MAERRRPRAPERGDDVGHGVRMADDQHRPRLGADSGDEAGRVARIVDGEVEREPGRGRGGGLARALVVADIDGDGTALALEPVGLHHVGERDRGGAAFGQQVRIGLALGRVEVSHDVDGLGWRLREGGGFTMTLTYADPAAAGRRASRRAMRRRMRLPLKRRRERIQCRGLRKWPLGAGGATGGKIHYGQRNAP